MHLWEARLAAIPFAWYELEQIAARRASHISFALDLCNLCNLWGVLLFGISDLPLSDLKSLTIARLFSLELPEGHGEFFNHETRFFKNRWP